MDSIIDTNETKQDAAPAGGSKTAFNMAIASALIALVGLVMAVVLFVQLRAARTDIGALQTRLADMGARHDKKAKDLDNNLEAVRSQTVTIAERAGMTEAELEKTAAAARQLREEQRKGQQSLATLDGEVGKVKDDVAASKAAIEQTQAQLQRAIGDLGEQSGLIARNAEELAALKRTNLREYYEFDLRRAKVPAAVGPVAVRLQSADPKRHKFTLLLVVDDISIEKKDKTLLEPVQFYRKGSRQLHEIVVYGVQKDRITGYLSTPKASSTETASK